MVLSIRNMPLVEPCNESSGLAVDPRLSSPTASVLITRTNSSSVTTTIIRISIVAASARKASLEHVAEGEQGRLSHDDDLLR